MFNMSYCRFQNTAADFEDCLTHLRSLDPKDNSENTQIERSSRRKLIDLAVELLFLIGIEDLYLYDNHEINDLIKKLDQEFDE